MVSSEVRLKKSQKEVLTVTRKANLLTFPELQALWGHRGPDDKAVGLIKRVLEPAQLFRPVHPGPEGHGLLRQLQFSPKKPRGASQFYTLGSVRFLLEPHRQGHKFFHVPLPQIIQVNPFTIMAQGVNLKQFTQHG